MQTIWNRLETQLYRLAPSIRESLLPGASEVTIQQAEAFLSIIFPEEVKDFYRIHNGQTVHPIGENTGIVNGWHLFSLKGMCGIWSSEWQDYGPPGSLHNSIFPSSTEERYPAFWHPKWLPFMGHWMGLKYCVDLSPGLKGQMGQILLYNDRSREYPDPVERAPSIRVVASGIQEFFAGLTNDLETGIYTFDDATGMLWDQKMLSAFTKMEARISGFDEETGEYWKENHLGYLKRKHKKEQRDLLSLSDEPDWEDLYRDHPIFGSTKLMNFDEYPF